MAFIRLVAALAAAMAVSAAARADISVKEVGSFHIGGREVQLSGLPTREIVFTPGAAPFKADPNGEFEVEQMYVQYVKLTQPKSSLPVLMIHGGGLSGVTWETKPDGKPGWQMFFLNSGFDVYVGDAVERGRASWARYPEIFKTEPFFRAKQEAWELFRIGPPGSYKPARAERSKFADSKFPIEAFDQFAKQGVPRWATNDAATQAAYNALIAKICPCIIVVHSQGGNFAFNAALAAPDKVKAIVALEPSGSPDAAKTDLAPLKVVPHLFIWGDHLDAHPLWQKIVPGLEKYRDAIKAQGADVTWLELAKAGISGNSHMLMMDQNSDEIAQLALKWLGEKGIVKP